MCVRVRVMLLRKRKRMTPQPEPPQVHQRVMLMLWDWDNTDLDAVPGGGRGGNGSGKLEFEARFPPLLPRIRMRCQRTHAHAYAALSQEFLRSFRANTRLDPAGDTLWMWDNRPRMGIGSRIVRPQPFASRVPKIQDPPPPPGAPLPPYPLATNAILPIFAIAGEGADDAAWARRMVEEERLSLACIVAYAVRMSVVTFVAQEWGTC